MNEGGEAAAPAADEYRSRLATRSQAAERWGTLDGRLSHVRLAVFVIAVVQAFLTFGTRDLAGIWLVPTIGTFIALLIVHDRVIQARRRSERSVAFYERGLARLEDRWAGTGNQRRRDDTVAHPFAEDLDLFGEGSLFELLCTARTPAGEEKLATWLLEPPLIRRQRPTRSGPGRSRSTTCTTVSTCAKTSACSATTSGPSSIRRR